MYQFDVENIHTSMESFLWHSIPWNISLCFAQRNMFYKFKGGRTIAAFIVLKVCNTQLRIGLPLQNIHFPNGNGSFPFHIKLVFPLTPTASVL